MMRGACALAAPVLASSPMRAAAGSTSRNWTNTSLTACATACEGGGGTVF